MGISANDVKILRERSGAGMMDCKKALVEAAGDIEKASDILREKGLAAAVKKAGRIAAEGTVASYIQSDDKIGALVEVNCETDFVAKTDEFKSFVQDIAEQIVKANPACVGGGDDTGNDSANSDKCLLNQAYINDPQITVSELVTQKIAKTGEKISIRRFTRYETNSGIVGSYIHMGGKIGVLVEAECGADASKKEAVKAFVHDITMQIAAAKPMYISESDIDPEVLAKEKEILKAQALNEGKPANVVDKMVEGRIKKFKKEICLLDQPYVKDPDISVQELINQKASETGGKIIIKRFARYEMGEGLEKRQDDFAKEVAQQAGL